MQVEVSVIIPSYERRKRIMNENLIVEDNTIYEIDPECLKKKRKCQGETGEKVETENTKKQKMQRRNR